MTRQPVIAASGKVPLCLTDVLMCMHVGGIATCVAVAFRFIQKAIM